QLRSQEASPQSRRPFYRIPHPPEANGSYDDAPRDGAGFPQLLSTARQSTRMVTHSEICRVARQFHSAPGQCGSMPRSVAMRSAFASRRIRKNQMLAGGIKRLPAFWKMNRTNRVTSFPINQTARSQGFQRFVHNFIQHPVNDAAQHALGKTFGRWINRRDPSKMD